MKRSLLVLLLTPIALFSFVTVSLSQYTITQLTDNAYDERALQTNDNGEAVWEGWDGSDHEIFLYDGTGTTQITNNPYYDGSPQTNDNGEVFWEGDDDSDLEIFLAIPCSLEDDNDDDGYVSASCDGDDCDDSNPDVNPGMSENEASGNCGDRKDSDCDGLTDSDPECGGGMCVASVEASPHDTSLLHDSSDLAKHLGCLLLSVAAVIGLRILRRKR